LTSNTTNSHIAALRRSGRISLYDPDRWPHEAYRRRLWMHPGIEDWVKTTGSTTMERKYHADVRALLKQFVTGGDFDDDEVLKEISDDGIWEIRITFEPQARMFGGFLRIGEFVATNWRDRKALSSGFGRDKTRCRTIWQSLFPKQRRLLGPTRTELLEEFDDAGL
jgi:hypothetical protein